MKKLLVTSLRCALGDCSKNGVTARNATPYLFIFDGNYTEMEHHSDKGAKQRAEAIAWCEEHGVNPDDQLVLVRRVLWGESHDYAEPLVRKEGGAYMASGNYIDSSDARFEEWTGSYRPIMVWDRFESWQEYNRNFD